MLTKTEIQKLLSQINEAFAGDKKRIDALETRVAALEEAAKPAKKAQSAPKAA